MEFRLTYAGALYGQNTRETDSKVAHKHALRRHFHKQMRAIWQQHPVLMDYTDVNKRYPLGNLFQPYRREGFLWQPLVRGDTHSIVCRLHIMMLRHGGKGGVLTDIDNRLKTLFDALQMVERPEQLPKAEDGVSRVGPGPDEDPFYVLLENDKFITALTVETDTLLEPVPDPETGKEVPMENAVRLFISVTARPYRVHLDNLSLL